MQKYGTTGQATDDTITRRMRFTFWITKATDTHSEYVINNSMEQSPSCEANLSSASQ